MMILLVEDHAELRQAVDEYLTESGHSVRSFASPEEALAWHRAGGEAKVVITDSWIPGTTARKLVHALREGQPFLPAIVLSDAPWQVSQKPGDAPVHMLEKPFRLSDLGRLLDSCSQRG